MNARITVPAGHLRSKDLHWFSFGFSSGCGQPSRSKHTTPHLLVVAAEYLGTSDLLVAAGVSPKRSVQAQPTKLPLHHRFPQGVAVRASEGSATVPEPPHWLVLSTYDAPGAPRTMQTSQSRAETSVGLLLAREAARWPCLRSLNMPPPPAVLKKRGREQAGTSSAVAVGTATNRCQKRPRVADRGRAGPAFPEQHTLPSQRAARDCGKRACPSRAHRARSLRPNPWLRGVAEELWALGCDPLGTWKAWRLRV